MTASRFPLEWPEGWARTPAQKRRRAPYKMPFSNVLHHLLGELRRFSARQVILSSSIPVKADGMPYAGAADKRYAEPGAACYFQVRGKPMVIACDCWDTVHANLHAIGLTIEAMRQVERTGATSLLERAFEGFKQLPPSSVPTRPVRGWWEVFGLDRQAASRDVIEAVYKAKARSLHPDHGGSTEDMAELNTAREQALAEIGR